MKILLENNRNSLTKTTVFLVIAPCSLVEKYRRFRGAYCLQHHGDLLDDEGRLPVGWTSVNFHLPTRCNNPKYSHLYPRCLENLKSKKNTQVIDFGRNFKSNTHPDLTSRGLVV
jgi:hypothetical protein